MKEIKKLEDIVLDENARVSVPLTPKNSVFKKSEGGLISLTLTHDDGTEEFIERVVIFRAFPITNPSEYISIRDPEGKGRSGGKEIGMIEKLCDFDSQTVEIINAELERRYFSPNITKIYSVREQFGYLYWDVNTAAGRVTFILSNPFSNIRVTESGTIYILDMDGNSFQIDDPKQLDSSSLRKIEMYL